MLFETLAVTAGKPSASSVGNVIRLPEPATALTAPAPMPAAMTASASSPVTALVWLSHGGATPMPTRLEELELPELDLFGLARDEARTKLIEARRQHWLAKNMIGYSVTHYEDVVAILRDRKWHSALA